MMHHNGGQNFLVHNYNANVQVSQRQQQQQQQHHNPFGISANDGYIPNVPGQHVYPTSLSYTLGGGNYVNSISSTQLLKAASSVHDSYSGTSTYTVGSDFTITPIQHTEGAEQQLSAKRDEHFQQQHLSQLQHQQLHSQQQQQQHSQHLHQQQQQQISQGDRDSSSEDEDVHQCGRCKLVFNSLKEYMTHKSSKVCKTKTNRPPQPTLATSPVIPVGNQNILEAAAKNTIFRDEFMVDTPTTGNEEEISKDCSPNKYQKSVESNEDMEGALGEENEGKSLIVLKVAKDDSSQDSGDVNRKRRGRPPKLYDPDDDSLRKTKRKSRPPRRHKPDGDSNDMIDQLSQDDLYASQLPQDEHGNVLLSALDPSGLPTVENIQKYFSGGRGRGRGRGRVPLHRCPICQLLFPNRPTMLEHKRKHTKIYKCKICNEGFYTEEKLNKHMTRETHSYACDECERVLTNKQALDRHKLLHTDKVYKCEECSRAFKTERDLKNHKVGMHSETKDFICEVCQKGFSKREKLKRHLMIHAPDRPIYTCPFKNHVGCEKTFYRKDKLTRHLYSHSKVKPFKCDQCDKSFARTDNLREHIRAHTGIFRYYCTVCGKGQPGPKKFLQHMFKQHNVENAEIPKPFDELAPEPLIQQHKAVVEAETAAKLARAATNLKNQKEKQKFRKDEMEEITVDPTQQHVTLATMNTLGLQNALLASPTQNASSEQMMARSNIETLYSINQHSVTSPQFQISRHIPETMVRQINENIIRERENALNRQIAEETDPTMRRHQLVESPQLDANDEDIHRQLAENNATRSTEDDETDHEQQAVQLSEAQQLQQHQQHQHQQHTHPSTQTLHSDLSVNGDGSIPVSRGELHLLSQGVLPGSLQFTTLLNSDLVAIGEAVIRNQNGIPTMFQQKYGHQ